MNVGKFRSCSINGIGSVLVAVCVLTALFSSFSVTTLRADPGLKKQILLVATHPSHRFQQHEYLQGARILAHCLNQHPRVAARVYNEFPSADEVARADALVLFCSSGGSYLLHDANRRAVFLNNIRRGMGFSALHFAVHVNRELKEKGYGDVYMQSLGAYFDVDYTKHPKRFTSVRLGNVGHPISRGVKPFRAYDEIYYRMRFMSHVEPVLVARLDDEDGDFDRWVSWCYERTDGGRSFGYTGGHFHHSFGADSFRRHFVNGVLWTAKIDVPESGATVDFDPAWLTPPARKTPAAQPPVGEMLPLFPISDIHGEWVTILDEESFPQWIQRGNATWTFEGGVLTASGAVGYIFSPAGDYTNFDYRAEVKVEKDGNSGMYFRTKLGKRGVGGGYEAQVNNSHGDPVRTGSLYHFQKNFEKLVPSEGWFQQRVIAIDDRIVILVDGVTVVDVEMNREIERAEKELVSVPAEKRNSILGLIERMKRYLTFRQGHFAFQQHHDGNVVHYRNVQVRRTPALTSGD